MMAEPLVRQHALIAQLLFETHQEFVKSAQAASCPRLVPRKGSKLPLDLSWMCTTDGFHGFKKLTHFPTVALAVSQSNNYVAGKVYDAPAGWHWATAAEIKAVPGWERKAGLCNYYGKGGWNGYCWEGVHRRRFAFLHSHANRVSAAFLSVSEQEGVVTFGSSGTWSQYFAGIVCIQD